MFSVDVATSWKTFPLQKAFGPPPRLLSHLSSEHNHTPRHWPKWSLIIKRFKIHTCRPFSIQQVTKGLRLLVTSRISNHISQHRGYLGKAPLPYVDEDMGPLPMTLGVAGVCWRGAYQNLEPTFSIRGPQISIPIHEWVGVHSNPAHSQKKGK